MSDMDKLQIAICDLLSSHQHGLAVEMIRDLLQPQYTTGDINTAIANLWNNRSIDFGKDNNFKLYKI